MTSWVHRQVEYWYGGSYKFVQSQQWRELCKLIHKSIYGKAINCLLDVNDTTEDKVRAKYRSYGTYRFPEITQTLQDFKGHDSTHHLNNGHVFPIFTVDCIGPDVPIIGYNRSIHKDSYAILWPLPYHYNIALEGWGDMVPFDAKEDSRILFRGALSGTFRNFSMGDGLVKTSRLHFLQDTAHIPFLDAGLTFIPDELKRQPEYAKHERSIKSFIKPHMPLGEILKHKYILCLEGADVSTAFGAILASNSVPLHPYPFCYHVWYFNGLIPWIHFVPIRADGSDLEETFRWCQSHPQTMRAIAEAGRTHMKQLLDPDNIRAIKEGVVALWNMTMNDYIRTI